MAPIPRSTRDDLEGALALLGAAATEEAVASIVRDYVLATPGARDWIHGEIRGADDIASCAVDLGRARALAHRIDPVVADLEVLFARACVRVAALLDPSGRRLLPVSQAFPRDNASPGA